MSQPHPKRTSCLMHKTMKLACGDRWGEKKRCRGIPTVHPCCVLDGRHTMGADAHDLLLPEQTRSFITLNLESLFYSAWAFMLLLTQKNRISALWFEARTESGSRKSLPQFTASVPDIVSIQHVHKMWFDFCFCILFFNAYEARLCIVLRRLFMMQ